MNSLKKIKKQISSIKSTQKITSTMKIIASNKMKEVLSQINTILTYQKNLNKILNSFLISITDIKSTLIEKRKIKRIAIVIFSSNTNLCGAFNSHIIKFFNKTLEEYKYLKEKNIKLYIIGGKFEDYIHKLNMSFEVNSTYKELIDKPNFIKTEQIANQLISNFLEKKIDEVKLIYNHCKNIMSQTPIIEPYLPIQIKLSKVTFTDPINYIIEPNKEIVLNTLILKYLHIKIYTILLDSIAAENTARAISMQTATKNANNMLNKLTIQYNKKRQHIINNELLDIINGSKR